MGKKKFIDKKKSATFQLLARDSSDPNYSDAPGSDRVFVRVDNNPVSVDSFFEEDSHCHNSGLFDDEDSIFGDAPDDNDEGGGEDFDRVLGSSSGTAAKEKGALPENVRREILELGFPDDGYNYLIHLREIRNTGGGSAFYHNPKFKPEQLPRDVKAYDASRVQILKSKENYNEKLIDNVASKTLNARINKVVDPEVAALLDDSDLSRFGSDVEDLEEDFVVRANAGEGEGDESDKKMDFVEESEVINEGVEKADSDKGNQEIANEVRNYQAEEKPRSRRLLDEQFDILELQEYGSDDNDDDCEGYIAEEEEFLAEKLKNVLNENDMDDLEIDDKYKAPADILQGSENPKSKELTADIMRRCAEYAEKYENESEDEKVLVVEESSDESEQFDCESIISTYSTLDNHPGKIEAPGVARKKKLAETVSGALSAKSQVISLRGKEKLPVDFLPNIRKNTTEKVKIAGSLKPEQLKRKQHGQETKEEKKERKVAVKKERIEARRMKKAMKELYRSEVQQAQKVAAISGPSSIRLM